MNKKIILEVERKFPRLTTKNLALTVGDHPPFQTLRYNGKRLIRDTYYDHHDLLSKNGLWIRTRNGTWQAKLRPTTHTDTESDNYTNTQREEITNPHEISTVLRARTGIKGMVGDCFGLEVLASFETVRESWVADGEFGIVLDTTAEIGHTVGEVELQESVSEGLSLSERKRRMEEMDGRIVEFMKRYSWAFGEGVAKGKLVAYFEWKGRENT